MNNFISNIDFDYENISITCEKCGKLNIFNRATDLCNFSFLNHYQTKCFNCNSDIIINTDIINNAYEMLYFKACKCFYLKEYMQTIILLCTAYEMFFMFVLQVFLTIKPLKNLGYYDKIEINKYLSNKLEEKVEKYSFEYMLYAFLAVILLPENHFFISDYDSKYQEKEELIKDRCIIFIKSLDKRINEIKKHLKTKEIEQLDKFNNIKDKKLKLIITELCKNFKNKTTINIIRNKIVHKLGYKPTKQEANAEIDNARNFIFELAQLLKVTTNDICIYFKIFNEQ